MKSLKALARLAWLLVHVLQGVWTVRRYFGRWSGAQREQAVQNWARGALRALGMTVQVQGRAAPGPLLLVANHVSWADILVLHACRYCRFVSKAEVRHWPVIGPLASAAGTLYIERESRRDALRVAHHMAESLRAGEVVAVFPEGTTSDGHAQLPFHANLLQAALSVHAPVQPVGLTYLDPATGALSLAPAYVGDDSLLGSLWRIARANGVCAVVVQGTPELPGERSRRQLAADLGAAVRALRER